jgi:hypothetical protein
MRLSLAVLRRALAAFGLLCLSVLAYRRITAPLPAPRSRSPAPMPLPSAASPRPSAGTAYVRMLRGTVRAGAADEWTLRLAGDRWSSIVVVGNPRAAFACDVRTAAGRVVVATAAPAARCSLRLAPAHSASYRITIRNAAAVPAAYRLFAR